MGNFFSSRSFLSSEEEISPPLRETLPFISGKSFPSSQSQLRRTPPSPEKGVSPPFREKILFLLREHFLSSAENVFPPVRENLFLLPLLPLIPPSYSLHSRERFPSSLGNGSPPHRKRTFSPSRKIILSLSENHVPFAEEKQFFSSHFLSSLNM
jgi:hypothetical protein